tara:strand:+ start:342 stop:590 length:249 start_codon:yes stop_codon:yes gene_type:complete
MTFIIAHPCVGTTDRACVDVCPVDCIYEAEEHNMLLINPDECIDCAACEPVCPVTAIFSEDEVPEEWDNYTDLNYSYFDLER